MQLTFECGHVLTVGHSVQQQPVCVCGETRITRVKAPPPSIRGVCSGPLVTPQQLEPAIVNLCAENAGPLPVPVDPRKKKEKEPHGR